MTISRPTRVLLLAGALLTACDDARVGDEPRETADGAPRGEYTREMIFVAADATGAALFDFVATDVGSAVRRGAVGWAEAGSGWTPLYDLTWDGAAMRQPWRLVPHGPLRLRVGMNDDVEAVLVREDAEDVAALEHGDFIAAWTPHPSGQIVLREASLTLGAEPIVGWLVDARFGVNDAARAEDDAAPNGPSAESAGAADTASAPAPPDSVDAEAALLEAIARGSQASGPIEVGSIRAVLVADDGTTLVVGATRTGLAGWLYSADGELTLPTVTLAAAQGERESWHLEASGDASLSGTLMVMDEDPMPVAPRIVRGTLSRGDDSLEMHGVLRPPAP